MVGYVGGPWKTLYFSREKTACLATMGTRLRMSTQAGHQGQVQVELLNQPILERDPCQWLDLVGCFMVFLCFVGFFYGEKLKNHGTFAMVFLPRNLPFQAMLTIFGQETHGFCPSKYCGFLQISHEAILLNRFWGNWEPDTINGSFNKILLKRNKDVSHVSHMMRSIFWLLRGSSCYSLMLYR